MRNLIKKFVVFTSLIVCLLSCEKDKENIDKVIATKFDTEVFKGEKKTIKIHVNNRDYYFDANYTYYTNVLWGEYWDLGLLTSNIGGLEFNFNAGNTNQGIDIIDKGLEINETRFTNPASGAPFFIAQRSSGQTTFVYQPNYVPEFYKFYYLPLRFTTVNGKQFYGYILVYVNPDKIIFGDYAYNINGKISAGDL